MQEQVVGIVVNTEQIDKQAHTEAEALPHKPS